MRPNLPHSGVSLSQSRSFAHPQEFKSRCVSQVVTNVCTYAYTYTLSLCLQECQKPWPYQRPPLNLSTTHPSLYRPLHVHHLSSNLCPYRLRLSTQLQHASPASVPTSTDPDISINSDPISVPIDSGSLFDSLRGPSQCDRDDNREFLPVLSRYVFQSCSWGRQRRATLVEPSYTGWACVLGTRVDLSGVDCLQEGR